MKECSSCLLASSQPEINCTYLQVVLVVAEVGRHDGIAVSECVGVSVIERVYLRECGC